ncbi:hypothetical protein [Xenorhabdus doucetiae]|uniref:hypothetical protein n=1 Tax=Xenorhabdus doucetiae TaxID=351671 RepID=UPI002B41808D|nr:hypothetical protein [Xenorhabdus sp. 18]
MFGPVERLDAEELEQRLDNLLNVALTRAKKHIFIIGDPAVWHELRGFRDVAKELPTERIHNLRS